MDLVEFDIGGTIFKTKRSTLKSIDGSFLSNLDDTKDKYFFDTDPVLFRHVLNAHRKGIIHVPRDVCPLLFKEEILFWKLPLTLVAPCCWKYMYEAESDKDTYKILLQNRNKYDSCNKVDQTKAEACIAHFISSDDEKRTSDRSNTNGIVDGISENEQTMAFRIWLLLDEPGSSTAAKIWCYFYIFMVVLSVVVYIIWLDPSVRVSPYLTKDVELDDVLEDQQLYDYLVYIADINEKIIRLVLLDPHQALLCLDLFCVVFFVLETIVHFLVCPIKRKYFLNVYNWLKIFLCIAMLVSVVLEFRKDLLKVNDYAIGEMYHFFKSCCALRLLLIFRLHKIYDALHIMLLSVRYSVKELLLLLFSFLIAVIVYGCLIFASEIESTMFASPQISMWWSLITMTTIGYGDFYPTTTRGYVVGILCAINGIIVLALPIAAIASTFSNLYSRNAEFQKHLTEVRKQTLDTISKDNIIHHTDDISTVSCEENAK
ncbi:potassium voltage-gated channel protein egl-36-like [Ruditapes philippinarum]|uniref:potassium voltage-gated channel protein egl-36-like n=1 Tax=Ruditapes philippinarum TaxID=129788 RepID=UPI00295B41C8|nr:potassium voltage-gated channel protein egl-36-like [Ruditapes philippinarum]